MKIQLIRISLPILGLFLFTISTLKGQNNLCDCGDYNIPSYSDSLSEKINDQIHFLDSIYQENPNVINYICTEPILFLGESTGIEGDIEWNYFGRWVWFTAEQLNCWKQWYSWWNKYAPSVKAYQRIAIDKVEIASPKINLEKYLLGDSIKKKLEFDYLDSKIDKRIDDLLLIEVLVSNYEDSSSQFSISQSRVYAKFLVEYLSQKYPLEKILVKFYKEEDADSLFAEMRFHYGNNK